jgi:hypothetical protein
MPRPRPTVCSWCRRLWNSCQSPPHAPAMPCMQEYYISGTGHFGDQNGDAGQEKNVLNTRWVPLTEEDLIQDRLLARGIMVGVFRVSHDSVTGKHTVTLVGCNEHAVAAVSFFRTQNPPFEVRWIQPIAPIRPGHSHPATYPEARTYSANECHRGHGLLRDWEGKPRCWTCGWPAKGSISNCDKKH